jgi:hypothetical protein
MTSGGGMTALLRHPRLDRGSMASAEVDTRIRGYDRNVRGQDRSVRGNERDTRRYGSYGAGVDIGCVAMTLSMRRPSSSMT